MSDERPQVEATSCESQREKRRGIDWGDHTSVSSVLARFPFGGETLCSAATTANGNCHQTGARAISVTELPRTRGPRLTACRPDRNSSILTSNLLFSQLISRLVASCVPVAPARGRSVASSQTCPNEYLILTWLPITSVQYSMHNGACCGLARCAQPPRRRSPVAPVQGGRGVIPGPLRLFHLGLCCCQLHSTSPIDPRRVKSSCLVATSFEEIGLGSGKWWKTGPSSDASPRWRTSKPGSHLAVISLHVQWVFLLCLWTV